MSNHLPLDKYLTGPTVIGGSNASVSVGAVTTETILGTVNLPALLPNSRVRVRYTESNNNNGNNKTTRARLGGISGTVVSAVVTTTGLSHTKEFEIVNKGATNSQEFVEAAAASGFGATGAVGTATVDTSVATTLVITGEKANSGDTLTLNNFVVELIQMP